MLRRVLGSTRFIPTEAIVAQQQRTFLCATMALLDKGKIRSAPKGRSKFGFIVPDNANEKDHFFHLGSAKFTDAHQQLYNGMPVDYDSEAPRDPSKGPVAVNIQRDKTACEDASRSGTMRNVGVNSNFGFIDLDEQVGAVTSVFIHKDSYYGTWPWEEGRKVRFNVDEIDMQEAERDGKTRRGKTPGAYDVVDE